MAQSNSVSIHDTTRGALNALLEAEGCECFQSVKLFTYFAGALLDYTEEGVPLNPPILLCNSITDFAKILPGAMVIRLGQDKFRPGLGKTILKGVAGLTGNGGMIFVERQSETEVVFGVLSVLAKPTALSAFEIFESIELANAGFAILMERVGARNVSFIGSKKNTLKVSFGTSGEAEPDDSPVGGFARACLANLKLPAASKEAENPEGDPEDTSEIHDYLVRCLTRCLNLSHGTILICMSNEIAECASLADSVPLDPPIDLANSYLSYRADEGSDSLLEIHRAETLLSGLMNSDGMVAFDERGRVVAFRVFYRPTEEKGENESASLAPAGGARRRAFEGVSGLLGKGLSGALMRSQDGGCEFKGTSK